LTDEGYSVRFSRAAEDDLRRLEPRIIRQLGRKLRDLAANARSARHKALKGRFKGLYRLRVGDYRVLYRLDRPVREIIVEQVGHRGDVYDE